MQKALRIVTGFGVLLVASGCTVQERLTPTSGDRAGGTVTLSYDYGGFERPVVNQSYADALAQQRCAVWGYKGAEPFGGGTSTCEVANGFGCERTRVDITYQCTGNPSGSHD